MVTHSHFRYVAHQIVQPIVQTSHHVDGLSCVSAHTPLSAHNQQLTTRLSADINNLSLTGHRHTEKQQGRPTATQPNPAWDWQRHNLPQPETNSDTTYLSFRLAVVYLISTNDNLRLTVTTWDWQWQLKTDSDTTYLSLRLSVIHLASTWDWQWQPKTNSDTTYLSLRPAVIHLVSTWEWPWQPDTDSDNLTLTVTPWDWQVPTWGWQWHTLPQPKTDTGVVTNAEHWQVSTNQHAQVFKRPQRLAVIVRLQPSGYPASPSNCT